MRRALNDTDEGTLASASRRPLAQLNKRPISSPSVSAPPLAFHQLTPLTGSCRPTSQRGAPDGRTVPRSRFERDAAQAAS